MKNRIASLLLVCALLMSLCVSAVARDNPITVQSGGAERFTDVPTSHWAYGYINKVVGSGLFNGKTPATFEPSSAMTRSQFVMVMARMEGRSDLEGVVTQTIFPDVTTTRRAAGPIKWATDEGFVNGFGDGTFKPDSPITRGQFAALIHRYITYKHYVDLNELDPQPDPFTDAASVSTAFTADVEFARVHGLLTGYSDGTVRAGNPITRAAIAAILARFLDLVTESGYTPLLDAPDTGNTDTDAPSSYDGITVKVNNPKYGATPIVRATRDGVLVASDDLKEGDRVTVTHTPNSGYTASMRVRDGNKKIVTVTKTDANTSWFTMPQLRTSPVTVTVTYARAGGGGGGGGSSSGGVPANYYLKAVAGQSVGSGGGEIRLLSAKPADATAVTTPFNSAYADLIKDQQKNNSKFTFYAVLKANDTSVPAGVTTSPAATVTGLTDAYIPTGYAVYEIVATSTNTTGVTATADITVTATFNPKGGDTPEPGETITVNIATAVKWADNAPADAKTDTTNYPADANGNLSDITLSADYTKAQPGDTVTITVPQYAGNNLSTAEGYFRYVRDSVVDSSGNTLTGSGNAYTLTVPDNAANNSTITVTAYYTVAKNETLTYNFTEKLGGEGNGTITVSALGFAPLTLTKGEGTKSATMDMQTYVKTYPAKDTADNTEWTVPFTITAAVADAKSTFDGKISVLSAALNADGAYELNKDKTATITATFGKIAPAYGYKLTVIGAGKSTVTFNEEEKAATGTATKPDTVTYGRRIGAANSFMIANEKTTDGWVLDSVTVGNKDFTAQAPVGAKPTIEGALTADAVTNITVVFRNENAVPVKFTVKTNETLAESGAAKVTAGGKILPAAGVTETGDALKAKIASDGLNGANGETVSSTTKEYYALSGTLVTLTNADANKKIKSISVTQTDGKDVSSEAGYSFILPESKEPVATVKFGTFDSYELMLTAPVPKDWANASNHLSAYSQNVGTAVTIEQLLKSLNNGEKVTADKANGITNSFVSTKLGSVIVNYAKSENGKARLEKALNDTVAGVLEAELEGIVKSSKETMLSGLESIVDQKLADYADKGDPKNAKLAYTDEASKAVKDFVDELFTGVSGYSAAKSDFIADATLTVQILNGEQSAKKQLVDALKKYAANLDVDVSGIKPVVEVKAQEDEGMTLTISAKLVDNAGNSTVPKLVVSGASTTDFDKYPFTADSFDVKVSVKADLYKVDANSATKLKVGNEEVSVTKLDATYNKVKSLSDPTISNVISEFVTGEVPTTDTIKSLLTGEGGVHDQIQATWDTETAKLNPLDMSKALTESTLNSAIDKILGEAAGTLTGRVKSLPKGAPETTKAFKNLYNEMVQFVGKKDNYLALRTTVDGVTNTLATIDTKTDSPTKGGLVIDLDFTKYLSEKDTTNLDKTSFEQLVSLLIALRTGFATDVQTNPANNGKTVESVVADLLSGHFNGRMQVKKWGSEISKVTDADEGREVAELLAELIMSELSEKVDGVWTDTDSFEAHGYQFVALSVGAGDGTGTGDKKDLYDALNAAFLNPAKNALEGEQIRAGFMVQQIIN